MQIVEIPHCRLQRSSTTKLHNKITESHRYGHESGVPGKETGGWAPRDDQYES